MDLRGEQRRAPRLDHELLVAYRTSRGFVSQWALNLSRGGLFVNTPNPQPVGSRLELLVHLPDRRLPCQVEGRVARVERGARHGMGVEFLRPEGAVTSRIDVWIKALRPRLAPNAGGRQDVPPK